MNQLIAFSMVCLFWVFFYTALNKPIKPKYEYHIILTNDSVFIFDRYNKQIGKYKSTNPKEQFDSILLLDNL